LEYIVEGMNEKMKYLIYGASGFLGGTLYRKLTESGHEVIGTYSTNRIEEELIKVDLLDTDAALELYRKERPDVIIWTIMNSDLEEVIAEQTLQPLLKEIQKCRFIFLSTSVAYEPNMSEDVTPLIRTSDMYNPHYFNGKIKGENCVASHDNYVIVRPGSIYGIDAYGNYDTRTMQLLNHIQEKKLYVRAKNICFSIVEVNELAEAIIELSQNDFVGTINISEEEPISHYDFNVALCNRYRWDSSYVIGNFENENIYYLNNELRKRVLKTEIGKRNRNNYGGIIMKINTKAMEWTRAPKEYTITEDRIEMITEPFTDLWQRTYYHFRNDNAPILQMTTDEKYFSFVVKTEFDTKVRYDQSGIVMYLDSENWLKAAMEYENDQIQRLGSVVTNNGYSDWSSVDVDASIKSIWFRLSRRDDDFCIENSTDGIHFKQMRICHMFHAKDTIQFGIYACSAEDSSFKATFTDMEVTECKWLAHDGQAPDEDI